MAISSDSIATHQAIDTRERVDTLRNRCLDRKARAFRSTSVAYARSMEASLNEPSHQVRRGRATRDVLASVRFDVDDLELLVGRVGPRPSTLSEAEVEAAGEFEREHPRSVGGQTGHCELNLNELFAGGIDGLRDPIADRILQATALQAGDPQADDAPMAAGFDRPDPTENGPDTPGSSPVAGTPAGVDAWRSFLLALDGLSAMIDTAADDVEALRDETPGDPITRHRWAELTHMAAVCRKIAHDPPETFWEAIQLLWFVDFAVMHAEVVSLVVPGRIDRSLRSFYDADTAAGRLTRDEALLLIESLYLLINEYIPDGLAMSVMVGGRDECGNDLTNDLSYLCLDALRRTRLVYPTVGVCYHPGTPRELTDLAVQLIAAGYSNPAFFGDETITGGLIDLGLPAEIACRYINSTCVEITPIGCSNVWVASPYINLCGLLLEEIAAVADDPPATYADFRSGYERRLEGAIAAASAEQAKLRLHRRKFGGKPLQSVFTDDCIARGLDIDAGGARVNWVESSFVGLANLADSLFVIDQEVYQSSRMDLAHVKAILDDNFEGAEATRLRFLNGYPKYGQGNTDVDRIVGETVRFCTDRSAAYPVDGERFVPGAFVWIQHEALGSTTGATPDGRLRGTPFADGAGPAQGRESRGPTAAIRSTTSWNHAPMIGGVAFNMKFAGSLASTPTGVDRLRDLVVEYVERGGFETQVNVVDAETLHRAKAHPEEYRDLVVRIGGYTDYFARLSEGMQDEVIRRTEYACG